MVNAGIERNLLNKKPKTQGERTAMSFIKMGKDSQAVAEKNAQEVVTKKESYGKTFRFRMQPKEEARITFVDGDLNPKGYLVPPRWFEHTIKVGGNWMNIACPERNQPEVGDSCPICELGDHPAVLVAGFTVIDHREFTSTKGNTYQDTRRILIAKPNSFELLNKIAMKRGGLAGCTFEVTRMTDKDASIGSHFDFIQKRDLGELKLLYQVEKTDPKTGEKTAVTNFEPVDFEQEIIAKSGDELRALGIGKVAHVSGFAGPSTVGKAKNSYADQL
jgi:hypothetical protein